MQKYASGQLNAADQASLDQQTAAAKAQLAQALGPNVDSTTMATYMQQIDNQALITKQQMLNSYLATGNQEFDQWASTTEAGQATIMAGQQYAVTQIAQTFQQALEASSLGGSDIMQGIQLAVQSNTQIANALQSYMGNLAKAYAMSTASTNPSGTAVGSAGSGVSSLLNQGKSLLNSGSSSAGGGLTGDPSAYSGLTDTSGTPYFLSNDPSLSYAGGATDASGIGDMSSATSGLGDGSTLTDMLGGFNPAGGEAAGAATNAAATAGAASSGLSTAGSLLAGASGVGELVGIEGGLQQGTPAGELSAAYDAYKLYNNPVTQYLLSGGAPAAPAASSAAAASSADAADAAATTDPGLIAGAGPYLAAAAPLAVAAYGASTQPYTLSSDWYNNFYRSLTQGTSGNATYDEYDSPSQQEYQAKGTLFNMLLSGPTHNDFGQSGAGLPPQFMQLAEQYGMLNPDGSLNTSWTQGSAPAPMYSGGGGRGGAPD